LPAVKETYHPDKSLADSLSDLALSLNDMPGAFTEMAANIDQADDNLVKIEDNLSTMSGSVAQISDSLGEYQKMVGQSKSSMDNLRSMLADFQDNLDQTINYALITLTVLMLWFLAAQVVIFSQGWELYHGTADRMEGRKGVPAATETETPQE